jgi:hypothetical protein
VRHTDRTVLVLEGKGFVGGRLAERLVLAFRGIGGGHSLRCQLGISKETLARLEGDLGVEVLSFLEGAKRLWQL